MFPPSSPTAYPLQVSRSDRWSIAYRLEELDIPHRCLADGSLQVEVKSAIAALLVRSVVQEIASRSELIDWLERCWQVNAPVRRR
jgi:hypothetical protein